MRPFSFSRLLLFLGLVLCGVVGNAQPLSESTRERDPYLTADGNQLFFSRPDHVRNQGTSNLPDVWIRTSEADGTWRRALNPGSPVNTFGSDRPIGVGPEGRRLAVLRETALPAVDVLERNGRSWRILDHLPLPSGLPLGELTFNPRSYELVYADNEGDLQLLQVTDAGTWSSPQPLNRLNTEAREGSPSFGADNRTLYYRSGGRWFYQSDRQLDPAPLAAVPNVNQLALATGNQPRLVGARSLNGQEELADFPVDAGQGGRVVRGVVPTIPAPGQRFVHLPVSGTLSLRVLPDEQRRYTLVLRPGERIISDVNLAETSGGNQTGQPLAALGMSAPDASATLAARIAYQEREVRRLDSLRKATRGEYYSTMTDPEYEALNDRLLRANELSGDTLPPSRGRNADRNATRARYADDISELERMKAKFRKQQEDKLNRRSSGRRSSPEVEWTARGGEPTTDPEPARPPIGTYYTPPPTDIELAELRRQDSLRMRSEINNGLYYKDRSQSDPSGTGNWERDLQRDLPRNRQLTPEEKARLDADYDRQMRELEAMREQLRRARNEPPASTRPATTGRPDWNTRSPYPPTNPSPSGRDYPAPPSAAYPDYGTPPGRTTAPAPNYYGNSAAPTSAMPATAAGMPVGVTFIPNTAYPDGAGYGALDQLARSVQNAGTVVEIRVHTSIDLDRRTAQLLSEERAVTIRNYLVEQGISAANFRVIGFGNNLTANGGERVEILR